MWSLVQCIAAGVILIDRFPQDIKRLPTVKPEKETARTPTSRRLSVAD